MGKQQKGFTRREFVGATLAGAAGLSLFGPSAMASTPKRGGELIVGVQQLMLSPDPHRYSGARFYAIGPTIWEGLLDSPSKGDILKYNRGLTDKPPDYKPMLAENWEVENGGQRYVFHLKKGVKFHNGKELDSGDVKFTWERIKEPKHQALNRVLVGGFLKSVETPDRYTVVANMTQPYGAFLSANTWIGSVIIPKDSIPWGVIWGRTQSFTPPTAAPPGTGPFKCLTWDQKHEARLEAFKEYRIPGLPYLDRIRLQVILKPGPRTMALRAGDIHYTEAVDPQWLNDIVKKNNINLFETFTLEKEGISLSPQISQFVRTIFLNNADYAGSPFADIRVRKALACTIDRPTVARVLFGELGLPSVQSYHPDVSIWGFKDLPMPKPDIEKAKQLLKEAGYPNGVDVDFHLNLAFPKSDLLGQIIQQMASQAGFRITLKPGRGSTYYDAFYTLKYDMLLHQLGKEDPIYQWHSYFHGHPLLKGYAKGSGVKDETLDKMLDDMAVGSTEERKAKFRKVIDYIVYDKTYAIPLYLDNNANAWLTKVKNFDPMRYALPGGCLRDVWLDE